MFDLGDIFMVFDCLSYNTRSTIRYGPVTLLPARLLNGIVRSFMIPNNRDNLNIASFDSNFYSNKVVVRTVLPEPQTSIRKTRLIQDDQNIWKMHFLVMDQNLPKFHVSG